MMKQEMRGQMAFQNKIRALKQIELSKYGGKENPPLSRPTRSSSNESSGRQQQQQQNQYVPEVHAAPSPHANHHEGHADPLSPIHLQQPDGSSLDEDFIWSPEDDDQIFDFLLDH